MYSGAMRSRVCAHAGCETRGACADEEAHVDLGDEGQGIRW